MINEIRNTFPTILAVVESANFNRQLNEFSRIAIAGDPRQTFDLLKASKINAKRFFQNIYGMICDPLFSYAVADLERDFRDLTTKFDVSVLKAAFAEKLLDDRFDNTLTEVAGAVVMSDVLERKMISTASPQSTPFASWVTSESNRLQNLC